MGLTPEFRLVANTEDVTDTIRQRFVSLQLTDEAGLQSDTLELILADHDPLNRITLPDTGAELELWLGYDGQAQRMGLFVVDELELSGPPDQLRISAKAAPQDASTGGKTNLQTQKTRSWGTGTTLGAMVDTIAQNHGMESAVSASLASIQLPHVDQVNESDMNLLTRVARPYDAIAKPAGGKLVLAKRGESKTTSGQQLDSVTITQSMVSNWRVTLSKRVPAGKVIAVWRDLGGASDVEAVAGSGEPVKRLRHQYPDQASAQKAANSAYQQGQRGERSLSLSLPGDPALFAEAPLTLTGFRAGVDGEWLITSVNHQLDAGGYRCSVSAEQPAS